MGGHQQLRGTVVKNRNCERDRCTLKRIVSINHRSAAAKVTAELDIHLDRFHINSLIRDSQIQDPQLSRNC